jgi:hypothetical protein
MSKRNKIRIVDGPGAEVTGDVSVEIDGDGGALENTSMIGFPRVCTLL